MYKIIKIKREHRLFATLSRLVFICFVDKVVNKNVPFYPINNRNNNCFINLLNSQSHKTAKKNAYLVKL